VRGNCGKKGKIIYNFSHDKSFGGVTKYGSLEKGIDDSYSDDDRCS
jgi:hypothetical protein